MDGRQPVFDVVSVSVDVLRTDSKALLQLTSTTQLDREPRQLRITGAKLFFDLIITASLKQETSDQTMQYFDYELAVFVLTILICYVCRPYVKITFLFGLGLACVV